MAMKQKRARQFVVGYGGRYDTVWGKRAFLPQNDEEYRVEDFCHLMTLLEARKAAMGMPCPGGTIYELVERS